jgi:hypothetical protein
MFATPLTIGSCLEQLGSHLRQAIPTLGRPKHGSASRTIFIGVAAVPLFSEVMANSDAAYTACVNHVKFILGQHGWRWVDNIKATLKGNVINIAIRRQQQRPRARSLG